MKALTVLAISLLMSAPAFAGTNDNCGNGDHGDRVGSRDRSKIVAKSLNTTSTRKPKKIKGRR